MSDERRQDDQRISEIALMLKEVSEKINEVHQRQQEVTMPKIKEIGDTLYTPETGICARVAGHAGEIKALNDRISKIPTIVGWIFAGVSAGAGCVLWIIEHGRALMSGGK